MSANPLRPASRLPDAPGYPRLFGQWKVKNINHSMHPERTALVKDLTPKRRLVEANRRLASALDQVMEIIAILDVGDGSIIHSNAAFRRMFGYSTHALPKPTFTELFECRALAAALDQAGSGLTWTGRSSLKTHAEKDITFEGTVSPARNAEGVVESLIVRLRDISLEVEKDRYLLQAQKMNALGTLAGGMAHDFNNLVAAILSAAELIEMGIEPDSPIQKKVKIIQRVGARAKELSAQILNFNRRKDDTWTPFDLTGLVEEAICFLQSTLPVNVDVRSDLAKGVRIIGDPSQLHQVITNLGINGSHAMQPGGGTLSIELRYLNGGGRADEQPFSEPCALLTIKDTGCGMEPKTLARIFEPFFTTKELGHGTGLGLSVVHGIVQGHGGYLQVSSEPGKGSTFKIHLPVHRNMHRRLADRVAESHPGGYLCGS